MSTDHPPGQSSAAHTTGSITRPSAARRLASGRQTAPTRSTETVVHRSGSKPETVRAGGAAREALGERVVREAAIARVARSASSKATG
jgi:hypothetical protein